jgi:hypothetical protein
LAEKQWTIRLVESSTGRLCGFSTQRLLSICIAGCRVSALFSGDTIVDRRYWGSTALSLAWGRLAFRLIEQHPQDPLYWFLICQGYRTYRFLPVFFREFYPRFDAATPVSVQSILDALARSKFGNAYDGQAGVVRSSSHGYRLRAGVAEPTPSRLRDPHVNYFVSRNPGHSLGDELCCLAPLALENFSATARRLIESPSFALPHL